MPRGERSSPHCGWDGWVGGVVAERAPAAAPARCALYDRATPGGATGGLGWLPAAPGRLLRRVRLTLRFPPAAPTERFRLNNIGPAEGAKTDKTRKGRGISAGQGATCGFGMRGQKSRSGTGTRPGFEGGQNPLYRRLPKLKGIAGGMPKGRTKFNTVNVRDLSATFAENDEVTMESIKAAGILKPTGAQRDLPLKILGEGEIDMKLTIKAGAATAGAVAKLEAAGCTVELGHGIRNKWVNPNSRRARRQRMREAGELASGPPADE